jgi:large subunit ribosomal protein L4
VQVPVYNLAGEVVEQIELSDAVFGVPFNKAVVHQAVLRQRANSRQGTVNTKTRSEVTGSKSKMYRQKHTGMARAGSRRSPLRRGGGIIFGPKPRDYSQALPKKMRQLALKCVLSAKAGDGELKVLEKLELEEPKTKEILRIVTAMGGDGSVLIVTSEPEENVVKSARNIPGTKTLPANLLNVVDILSHKMLLMTVPAVRKAERIWGPRLSQGGG